MKLFYIFVTLLSLNLWSQEGFFPGSPKPTKDRVSYGYAASSGQRSHRLSARKRILNTDERYLALFTKNEITAYEGPDFVPPKLGSLEFGLGFNRKFQDRQSFGLIGTLGSGSNQPFRSWNEIKTSVTSFYEFPGGDNDSWILSINYATHRGYMKNYPLPGLAYFYKNSSETFQGAFGLPLFISWEFQKNYILMSSALFPYLASLELAIFDFMPFKLRSGFRWEYKDYLLSSRSNKDQSFYYDQKSVFVSAGMPLLKFLSIDLVTAYAWDRRLFIAEGFFKKSKAPYHRLSDGLQASLDLNAVF